jgi:pentatricopeptide repeat protein
MDLQKSREQLQQSDPDSLGTWRPGSRSIKYVSHGLDPPRPVSLEEKNALQELQRLGRAGKWAEALLLYGTVPEPGIYLQTSVLDACAKSLQLDQARKLFNTMRPLTVATCNVMVLLLGRMEQIHEAKILIEEMRQAHLQPNEVTYVGLITGFGMIRDAEATVAVLDQMRKEGLAVREPAYGAAMSACAKAGAKDQVVQLLAEMDERKLEPDVRHFGSLLTAYARCRDEQAAHDTFAEIRRRGLKPGVVAYTSLMASLSGPDALAKAEALIQEMEREGIKLDTFAWNNVLGKALEVRDSAGFRRILAQMDANGIEHNRQTVLRITDCEALDAEENALGTSNRLKPPSLSQGSPPLPQGWCEHADPATGRSYFWMEADPHNTVTWNRPT